MNKKIVLITGCNGYISNLIINQFKNENYFFIGCDLQEINNVKTKNSIKNGLYKYFKCDISKDNQIYNLFKKLKEQSFIPNILINNAAIDSVPNKNQKMIYLI